MDIVDAVRAFNRFYTVVIGVLQEGLSRTPWSLTEARVLWELAHADELEVTELRRQLGLDAGYLSRVLGRFEADGLIRRRRAESDARRQVLSLTARGRRAFEKLDRSTAAEIRDLVAGLDENRQRRLVEAMATIRRILGDHTDPPIIVLRPPRPGDLGWIVERNAALYAEEYGWDASYEALVARIVADFAAGADPARAAWIAEVDGQRAGCVMCVPREGADDTAQLRLLLVEPWARGAGIGSRLVEECLRFADGAGYRRMVLWTNDVLVAARRIYEKAGFTLVDEEPHHSFGHDLVGQWWARDL